MTVPADRNALLERSFDLARDSGTPKLTSLGDAVHRFVQPGMAIHLCWSHARPNAAVAELVRRFAGQEPGFTFSSAGFANTQAALVASGIAKRLITAYAGESYPAGGINRIFKRAIDDGAVEIENWSQWTFVQRLMAGALGLPFMPTRSLTGSSLAAEQQPGRFAEMFSPFGGETVGVVAPLVPDIAFLQGLAADPFGNVVMSAPYGESHWGAMAARQGVIACVERIVPTEELRQLGPLVRVPGHVVRAVCLVPFGSHPYGSFTPPGTVDVPSYVEDGPFIIEAAEACEEPAQMEAWLDEWVFGLPDHDGYLEKLGTARLSRLQDKARPESWREELATAPDLSSPDFTEEEAMIVVASRHIARRVREAGHATILAGIGASNLASWLAERTLTETGTDVALISEIGIYGYAPRPGEPFVFSNRNVATARQLTDVSMTLGTLCAGVHNRCLGALGAAVVDKNGNIGTTYDQRGGFIVGSGGGNDIASAAAEILVTVKHGRRRLVETTAYVTSPGDRVRAIVTSRAVLARENADKPFVIVSVHAPPGTSVADAVAQAQADCGWPLEAAASVRREHPPSVAELEIIRAFDPERHFLGAVPAPVPSGVSP